jgi:acetylornithine deacetylase
MVSSVGLPDTREMIGRLVASPSVSSTDPDLDQKNLAVVDRIAEWGEAIGGRISVWPIAGREGKANVCVRFGGDGPGGLILSGHTDTVPWDEGAWQSDPFTVTERDGRLHGLGTADMKSFLALALEAASAYRASDLREPLLILGTADEESTMSGARALTDAEVMLARRAVIGEPTNLTPIRAHKGILIETIELLGRSGHSSDPRLGVSALDGMRLVLDRLVRFREALAKAHQDASFDVPVPTLNLGRLVAGDAPNRICAHATLEIDLRPLPGMDLADVREKLRAEVRDALEGSALELRQYAEFAGVPPFSVPEDAALVGAAEALTGRPAGSVAFGTEAPFLMALGIETIVLGPGSIDVAHRPDEYLPVADIPRTVALLRALIERYCVSPNG